MSKRWLTPGGEAITTSRMTAEEFRKTLGLPLAKGNIRRPAASLREVIPDRLLQAESRLIRYIQQHPPLHQGCPHESELMRFINGGRKVKELFSGSLEHLEQVAFFYVLSRKRPDFYEHAFSVPNGGFRKAGERFRLQAEGQKSGVPDVLIPFRQRGFVGLAIEFKRKDGRESDIRDEQHNRLDLLRSQGWKTAVAFGAEDGLRAVEEYLGQ